MLKGIFLVHWDPKKGPYIKVAYPPDLELDHDLIIKVYGANVLVERVERYTTVQHGEYNIACYYSGFELNLILAALVVDEPADVYQEGLITIAPTIFRKKGLLASDEEWKELFTIVESMPRMVPEEKIAYVISDPIRREILNVLIERGFISMEDLRQVLKSSKINLSKAELHGHVDLMERVGIVKVAWAKKKVVEYVVLVSDPVFLRVVEEFIVADPECREKAKAFYDTYDWKKDQEILASVLSKGGIYKALQSIKSAKLARNELPLSDEDIDKLIDLGVFSREGDTLMVLSIPKLFRIFPKYTVAQIIEQVSKEQLEREDAIELLRAIRSAYEK